MVPPSLDPECPGPGITAGLLEWRLSLASLQGTHMTSPFSPQNFELLWFGGLSFQVMNAVIMKYK